MDEGPIDRVALPPTLSPGRYRAVQHGKDGDTDLGALQLHEDGMLAPDTPDGVLPDQLAKIVRSMNGKAMLHVDVFPPADAPRFAMTSRIVPRGEPDFIPALLQQLQRYYDVELVAA